MTAYVSRDGLADAVHGCALVGVRAEAHTLLGRGWIAMASDYAVEEADHDILIVNHPTYLVLCGEKIVAYCEDKGCAHMIADTLNLVRKLRELMADLPEE